MFLCSTFATGPKPRISFARLTFMQIKAFASQLLPGSVRKPFTLWRDTHRMSFPEFQLSRHSKVRVFGGITANNEAVNMPKNYIALTCQIQMSFFSNYPTRILHDPVAQSANVVDYIFKFKQSRRPLGVIRMVHLDLGRAKVSGKNNGNENSIGAWLNDSVRVQAGENDMTELVENNIEDVEDENPDVEALKEILSCITVPVRVDSERRVATLKDGVSDAQVLSLMDDGDLRRHLIAVRSNLKEAAVRIVQCAAW